MIKLRISVVTPSFNMARYLPSTIESTLDNLGPDDEYFIIDGGSTDGSKEIIESYSDRLTGWISEPDHGYADALKKGFARVSGDILCWINAGDLLLPGALDTARKLIGETGAQFIFGDDFNIDESDFVITLSRGRSLNLRKSMVYGGWTPLQDACFWRRDLYQQIGGIDASLKYAADYDLFLRMTGHCIAQYVPIAFSAFRTHRGQKSIAGAKHYKVERQSARKLELSRGSTPAWQKLAAELWYYFAMRFRARVLQRIWRLSDRRFIGAHISGFKCEKY